ncbi:leucyl aminopeptidase [archaeon]|jgi:leucyl aminopeptidase|nr:leucyl aminopeptidase [archaeon]MBT3451650.1 leucyl aminopeptidase [archaeon]MBT6869671.1 leucyl aminopeptidase [archaeon]MBT7192439.1 leucyl aminopeptidase [archaeon]MBT7380240.1 leucyl aminopeptidase [archaeon]
MKIKLYSKNFKKLRADLLIVPLFETENNREIISLLGKDFVNKYKQSSKNKIFKAKFGECYVLNGVKEIYAKQVLMLGLGKKEKFDLELLRRISSVAYSKTKSLKLKSYISLLSLVSDVKLTGCCANSKNCGVTEMDKVFAITESTLLSDYKFDQLKTKKNSNGCKIEELLIYVKSENKEIESAVKNAVIVAEGTNYCRDLVNLPPNILGPSYFSKEALRLKSSKVKVRVLGDKELVKGKFGGILAVSSGSAKGARLIVIDYNPAGAKESIALVGKGITFDAGGLNLKPSSYISTMKSDMSGAAAVISTLKIVSKLGLKKRVIGVIPTCENMTGSKAYRPDDILKMYNGKTVEIGNTDAEGRLILADALAFVEKNYKPEKIVDLATLTGACVVALGHYASGILSRDDDLVKELTCAANKTGDRVWRLPMWDDYMGIVDGDISDIRNIGRERAAGTVEGAVFLSHFVKKTPWAHLDIAGTAFLKESKYYLPKYGTGAGVRLLVEWLS